MWKKLEWRLRAIANDEQNLYPSPCKIVRIKLYVVNGSLVGWEKPDVRVIEPKNIDPIHLQAKRVSDSWQRVISDLQKVQQADLVIYKGAPYGWLNGTA
jgi:hypothetical protein